jgi:hypothetical protein
MDNQLLGTCGVYYAMSRLAFQEVHASCTFGNAPHVDILASSKDGSKSVSLQVKTAKYAKRFRGRGNNKFLHEYQWYLGFKAARASFPNLFMIFVDLNIYDKDSRPDCYILPSHVVSDHCKDWIDHATMARFHVSPSKIEPFRNKWDLIKDALK